MLTQKEVEYLADAYVIAYMRVFNQTHNGSIAAQAAATTQLTAGTFIPRPSPEEVISKFFEQARIAQETQIAVEHEKKKGRKKNNDDK